jgi:nicotinate-nucleotide adenylyltransferase
MPEKVSDFWHRYQMTVLATASNKFFEVSRLEHERGGCSYSVDTVRAFQRLYEAGTELFFITGADAILEVIDWKQPEELLAMCRFIAATRPGYDLRQLDTILGDYCAGSVSLLEIPLLDISSSDIRGRLRRGASIKYLVPEAVEAYIVENGLYRSEQ